MDLRIFENHPIIFAESNGEICDVFIIMDKDDVMPMTQLNSSKTLCYYQKTKSIGYLNIFNNQFTILTPKIECKVFEDIINTFIAGWNKHKNLS